MATYTIDTHATIRELEEAGMDSKQAEVVVAAISRSDAELATKAALCSRNRLSAIIVIDENGRIRAELASAPDLGFLQGIGDGKIGYSRGLAPVGADFILSRYQAYGGQKPPPINHQGINDAFLGKASRVHYFHDGKWLELTGSD